MQEELERIMERSNELSKDTKLGDGYAQQVSNANTIFGQKASQQLINATKVIESLKTQIEKSRASYQNVDQSHADSLKKLNGNS